MRSQYDSFAGKDNVDTSQFSVNPFQRVEISISGINGVTIDRNTPELFPQLEGTSIYVERTDYPVLLSLVSPSANLDQSIIARDGDFITADFKGVYISHPPMLQATSTPLKISLIICKNGSRYENTLGSVCSRFHAPYRNVTNAAGQQQDRIFVPEGVRRARVQMRQPVTTMTDSVLSVIGRDFTAMFPSQQDRVINNNALSYALGTNPLTVGPDNFFILGANAVVNFPEIALPSLTVELNVNTLGTGLGTVGKTYYVLFS